MWNENTSTLLIGGIEPSEAGRIWGWAAETNTAIRQLEPAVNSLEQIFMDVASGALAGGERELAAGAEETNDAGS